MELAQRLRARHPVRVDDEGASARVIRTGEPVLMSDITPEMLRAAAEDPEHLALLEGLGLSALLIAPLRTGDDVLGTLSLVASQPHRRFDDADLEVADALGPAVADALRNDRLLRDRVEMARVPLGGPASRGPRRCSPAARSPRIFTQAGEHVEAGGDFYDVIDAPAGSIVVMGDVVGKGAPAAALSAVDARDAAHRGAADGRSACGPGRAQPHAAPARADEPLHGRRRRAAVRAARPRPRFMLAGHPQPLLLRDGVARPVGRYGPMLGAVEVPDWTTHEVELAPDDVLVLYTDGVLDMVLRGGERYGEARLRALVESAGARRRGARGRVRGGDRGPAAARRRRPAGHPLPGAARAAGPRHAGERRPADPRARPARRADRARVRRATRSPPRSAPISPRPRWPTR